MIRHNLDVMHIEKILFENVFNIFMNIKCNALSREDVQYM